MDNRRMFRGWSGGLMRREYFWSLLGMHGSRIGESCFILFDYDFAYHTYSVTAWILTL